MDDARIVIGDGVLVVAGGHLGRGDVFGKEGGAIEGGGEPGDEGALLDRAGRGERPRGAGEDVPGRGFAEGQARAVRGVGAKVQLSRPIDRAVHRAPLRLRVHAQRLRGVAREDCVYVRGVVVREQIAVARDAVAGAQGSEVVACRIFDDQVAPAGVIGALLCGKAGTHDVEAVGGKAGHILHV